MAEVTRDRISAAAFLALPEINLPTELLDSEVIMSPSPSVEHQRWTFRLAKEIERLAASGEVFVAPLDVYLDEANVVQPDVLWLAPQTACVIEDQYLSGAPDLVVEVLSPGTAQRDREQKRLLYGQHGVGEYWIVDLDAQSMTVWQQADGQLIRQGEFGGEDAFTSAILGARFDVGAFFSN